jgi:hypothetical protein
MNHRQGKVNEADRWGERPIGSTRALGQRDSHATMRNSGFGRPLSHNDRQQASGEVVPCLATTESDASYSDHSSFSSLENPSNQELSQMPLPPPCMPSSLPTVEISPGVHVRLRGANETLEAIESDSYMPAECFCCESTIFCIQQADYILCPDCRVVSRMEGISCTGMGGVGLGFKYEDLARWQADILRDQQLCRIQHVPFRDEKSSGTH